MKTYQLSLYNTVTIEGLILYISVTRPNNALPQASSSVLGNTQIAQYILYYLASSTFHNTPKYSTLHTTLPVACPYPPPPPPPPPPAPPGPLPGAPQDPAGRRGAVELPPGEGGAPRPPQARPRGAAGRSRNPGTSRRRCSCARGSWKRGWNYTWLVFPL